MHHELRAGRFRVVVTFALGLAGSTPGRAQPATPNPKNSDANPQAYWSTPGDGRLVLLARNAAGFDKPMPLRVRVCVTNFTGANNSVNLYIWTTTGFQSGACGRHSRKRGNWRWGNALRLTSPPRSFFRI